jgi:hypothetical protein
MTPTWVFGSKPLAWVGAPIWRHQDRLLRRALHDF